MLELLPKVSRRYGKNGRIPSDACPLPGMSLRASLPEVHMHCRARANSKPLEKQTVGRHALQTLLSLGTLQARSESSICTSR